MQQNMLFRGRRKSEILQRTLDDIYTAGPILIVSLLTGVITTVSPDRISIFIRSFKFKVEKINPISGFKRIFSVRSLVEALKGYLNLFLLSQFVTGCFQINCLNLHGLMHLSASSSFAYEMTLLSTAYAIILGLLIIAILILPIRELAT